MAASNSPLACLYTPVLCFILWILVVSGGLEDSAHLTTILQARAQSDQAVDDWKPATATWYGSPSGDGSDGGACGYGSLGNTPYGFNTSAGSPILFQSGKGCGTCYQVKCIGESSLCSTTPVTVVITDECPGCEGTHFDMSGSAFGEMASTTTLTTSLLNVGVLQVLYKRVKCVYPGTNIAFQVNQGATSNWFSILIKYVSGDGDIAKVELLQATPNSGWQQMVQLWGAYWCLNAGPLVGPFSIRITSSEGATVLASNAIPSNWTPGSLYASNVNFS